MTVHQVRMVFRRGMSARPINRTKNIIDVQGAVSGGSTSVQTIATTVDTPTSPFKPGDITVGGKINGFYVSIFVIGSTGAPLSGPINWYLWKQHAGQAATQPTPGQTGTSELRNQIIHEEKGLSGSGDGTPMVFKGVIAVPKGMRRMRSGDEWQIALNSDIADTNNFCTKVIYNAFY